MPYYATTGAPFQYQKSNGGLASNYYLKYYQAGTTTALSAAISSTATDENGDALLLSKIRLNTLGYPVSPSGGVVIPHLDRAYKVVLFQNATDADADNTSSADWVVDNLSPGLIGFTQSTGANDSANIDYLADPTGTTRTVKNKLQEFVSVKDFGAIGDGSTDDSTAISTALLASQNVVFPEGIYLCGGIIVQTTGQSLHFQGGVYLKANANSVVLFKQVSSYCKHTGSFFTISNSKSSVWGMQVGPSDLTNTTTVTSQLGCTLPGIIGDTGLEEGVVIQCGPEFSGSYSFNQGNVYNKITGNGSTRTLWLKSAANAAALIPKSNVFQLVDAGTGNTGIQIDAGSNNVFNLVQLSLMSSGGSPNATPTAIKIANTCSVTSQSNDYNEFLGGLVEFSTRDFENANANTQISGLEFSISNSSMTARPVYMNAVREINKIYAGSFDSAGTKVYAPTGWTTAALGGSAYRVTHNLGTTNYMCFPSSSSDSGTETHVNSKSSNSFDLQGRVVTDGSVGAAVACDFIVVTY